jgi:hypothetical protein
MMTSFDPLDLEILERALKDAKAAVQNNDPRLDFDSDEELEAALRRELIEIACSKAVSDPETLLDLLLARLCGEAVDLMLDPDSY